MGIFTEIFAWWTGNTIGTRFTLWKAGAERVGSDALGNTYYRAGELYPGQGERRWVIYNGPAEGSKVPPAWHAWMTHTVDEVPAADYKPRGWEKPHLANQTGSAFAYRPSGSILASGVRPKAPGDYKPWSPN